MFSLLVKSDIFLLKASLAMAISEIKAKNAERKRKYERAISMYCKDDKDDLEVRIGDNVKVLVR